MNRIQFLQNIINDSNFKRYLEIGTFQGDSLLPLICKKKIAVDPNFQISLGKKLKWMFKNPSNIFNSYFEMSSEEFFIKKAKWLNNRGEQDLVFIDGLHTFRASLSDVLFSLKILNPIGIIVLHDCFPPNKAASTPSKSIEDAEKMQIEGWKKEWCGDVWKTIVYLKEQYKEELEIIVLNTDYGLGVLKVKSKENFSYSINEKLYNKIDALNYEYLNSNPKQILNLREVNDVINSFNQSHKTI